MPDTRDALFRTLADPTRRAIFEPMRNGFQPVAGRRVNLARDPEPDVGRVVDLERVLGHLD